MKKPENKIARARTLRRNATDAEQMLWRAINYDKLGVKFRRQQPIGNYYVDFICFERKIILELDGDQHASDIDYDNRRTDYLEFQGYRVIRLPNSYVYQDLDSVINSLKMFLDGAAAFEDFFQSRYKI